MVRKLLLFAMLGILDLAAGCGSSRPDNPPIVSVDENDAAMNGAIQRARQEVGTFIQALQNPRPNQSTFAVKKEFTEGDTSEHMWIVSPTYDGSAFRGRLDNEPGELKNVKLGDAVTISPKEISDWMYVEDDKLVGGYTIRVLRDRLSADEKREHDASLPFKFE